MKSYEAWQVVCASTGEPMDMPTKTRLIAETCAEDYAESYLQAGTIESFRVVKVLIKEAA